MKKKKLSARMTDEPRPVDGTSLIETITRFWVTIVVILIILYAALLMISRTDGFSGLLRQRLENLSGIPISVERVHANLSMDLVVEGLRGGHDLSNRFASITIGRAEMYWNIMPLIRGSGWPFRELKVNDCDIRFSQDKEGTWQPLTFLHQAIAPWVEIEDEAGSEPNTAAIEYLRSVRAKIDVSNVNITWLGATDESVPRATIKGLNFRTEPVRPMGQDVLWCKMQIARSETEGIDRINQLDIEWIRQSDQDVVLRMGDLSVKRNIQLPTSNTP